MKSCADLRIVRQYLNQETRNLKYFTKLLKQTIQQTFEIFRVLHFKEIFFLTLSCSHQSQFLSERQLNPLRVFSRIPCVPKFFRPLSQTTLYTSSESCKHETQSSSFRPSRRARTAKIRDSYNASFYGYAVNVCSMHPKNRGTSGAAARCTCQNKYLGTVNPRHASVLSATAHIARSPSVQRTNRLFGHSRCLLLVEHV